MYVAVYILKFILTKTIQEHLQRVSGREETKKEQKT